MQIHVNQITLMIQWSWPLTLTKIFEGLPIDITVPRFKYLIMDRSCQNYAKEGRGQTKNTRDGMSLPHWIGVWESTVTLQENKLIFFVHRGTVATTSQLLLLLQQLQLRLQHPRRKSNTLISQPHNHFGQLLLRHWHRSMCQLLTSSMSCNVGSPSNFMRSNRLPICFRGCQSLCSDIMQ